MTTLKRLRQSAGLTREQFAQLTEVNSQTLAKHEQGRVRMPLDTAARYAQGLAIRMGETPNRLLLVLAGMEAPEQ